MQQMFSQYLGDYNICLADTDLPCQASYDEQTKELVLMLVNASSQVQHVRLQFDDGWQIRDRTIQEIVLTGENLSDTNTIEKELVRPECRQILLPEIYEMPPFTFSVLRIAAGK